MRLTKPKIPKWLKSIKYVLGSINCLFLLTGLLLIVTGVVMLSLFGQYELFLTNRFYSLITFVIATGAVIVLTSALGFYGAVSQQFYFILAYLALCFVVLVFDMSIAIAGSRLRDDVSSEIRPKMVASMNLYQERSDHTKAWDDLQMEFECCGVSGRNDWKSSSIPVSCCHIDYGTVSPFVCEMGNAFDTGCLVRLSAWMSDGVNVVAMVGLVAICLQVVVTALAAWVAWRSKYQQVELES